MFNKRDTTRNIDFVSYFVVAGCSEFVQSETFESIYNYQNKEPIMSQMTLSNNTWLNYPYTIVPTICGIYVDPSTNTIIDTNGSPSISNGIVQQQFSSWNLPEGCQKYKDSVGNCLQCDSDYFLDQGICYACNYICGTCDNDTTCLTCASTTGRNQTDCICYDGYYDDELGSCIACDSTCNFCDINGCTECKENRIVNTSDQQQCICQSDEQTPIQHISDSSYFCTTCTVSGVSVETININEITAKFNYEIILRDFDGNSSIFSNKLCAYLFDSNQIDIFGQQPKCKLVSGGAESKIHIKFSYTSTHLENDHIQFASGKIKRNGCNSYMNNFQIIQYTPLSTSLVPYPVVKIQSSNQYSLCQDIEINIYQVINDGYHSLQSITWRLISVDFPSNSLYTDDDVNYINNINTQILANFDGKLGITIPQFSLEEYSQYQIKVTFMNYLGVSAQQSVSFLTLSNEQYQLKLLDKYAPLQFQANQYQELSYQVSKLTCNLQNQKQESLIYGSIDYKLSLMDNDNYDTVTQVLQQGKTPSDSKNGQIIYIIEPYQFQAGHTYYLLFQVIKEIDGIDYGMDVNLEFEVSFVDYVVAIQNGNRIQSYNAETLVQGEYYDLNVNEQFNQDGFTLNWKCTDLSENDDCKNIEGNYINVDQFVDFQKYPPKYFEPFDVLQFTFTATKNFQSIDNNVNIVILEDDIPSVKVDIEKQLLVNQINLSDNIYVKIDYDEADVEGVQYTAVLIYNYDKVAVKSYYYNEFQFKVWDLFNDFLDGQYAITLKVLVYNTSGFSVKTEFHIQVLGCQDTDLLLKYKYSYYINENEYNSEKISGSSSTKLKKQTLQGYNNNNQLTTVFPRLNQTLGYTNLIIMVSVQDQLKGYNNFTTSVTIQTDSNIQNQLKNIQDQYTKLKNQQEDITIWKQLNLISVLIQDIYQGQEQLFQNQYVDQVLDLIFNLQQLQNELKKEITDNVQLDQILYNQGIIVDLQSKYNNQNDIDINYYKENLIKSIDQQIEETQQLIDQGLIYSSGSYVNEKLNGVKEVLGKSLNQFDILVNTKIKQPSNNSQAQSLLKSVLTIGQVYNNITLPNAEQIEYFGEKMKTIIIKQTPQLLNNFFVDNSFQNGNSQNNNVVFDKNFVTSNSNNYDVQYIEILDNIFNEDFIYSKQNYPLKQTQIKNDKTQQNIELNKPLSYNYDQNQYDINYNNSNMVCIQRQNKKWTNDKCQTFKNDGNLKCECQTIGITSIVNDVKKVFSSSVSQLADSISKDSIKNLSEFEYYKSILMYFLVLIIVLNIYLIYNGLKKDKEESSSAQKIKKLFTQRNEEQKKQKSNASQFKIANLQIPNENIEIGQQSQKNEIYQEKKENLNSSYFEKRNKQKQRRQQIKMFKIGNNINQPPILKQMENENEKKSDEYENKKKLDEFQNEKKSDECDIEKKSNENEIQLIQYTQSTERLQLNSKTEKDLLQKSETKSEIQVSQNMRNSTLSKNSELILNTQNFNNKYRQYSQELLESKIFDAQDSQQSLNTLQNQLTQTEMNKSKNNQQQQKYLQEQQNKKQDQQQKSKLLNFQQQSYNDLDEPYRKFSIFNTFLIFHEFFSIFFVYMAKEKRPVRYMLYFLKQYLALAFLSFFNDSDKSKFQDESGARYEDFTVNFSQSFGSVPNVFFGVNYIDVFRADTGRNHLISNIQQITETYFVYRMYTDSQYQVFAWALDYVAYDNDSQYILQQQYFEDQPISGLEESKIVTFSDFQCDSISAQVYFTGLRTMNDRYSFKYEVSSINNYNDGVGFQVEVKISSWQLILLLNKIEYNFQNLLLNIYARFSVQHIDMASYYVVAGCDEFIQTDQFQIIEDMYEKTVDAQMYYNNSTWLSQPNLFFSSIGGLFSNNDVNTRVRFLLQPTLQTGYFLQKYRIWHDSIFKKLQVNFLWITYPDLPEGCQKYKDSVQNCLICDSNYYKVQGVCYACNYICGTCDNDTTCLTCASVYGRDQTNCFCYDGYYDDEQGNCVACDITCNLCDINGCIECKGNRIIDVNNINKCECLQDELTPIEYTSIPSYFCTTCTESAIIVETININEIVINFAYQINLVSFEGNYGSYTSQLCAYLFENDQIDKFGQYPLCKLVLGTESKIYVQFSLTSTYLENDSIQFANDKIQRDGCTSTMNKYELIQYIQIDPNLVPQPVAKIQANSQYSLCQDIEISIFQINNSGYHGVYGTTWRVISVIFPSDSIYTDDDPTYISNLNTQILSNFDGKTKITIPSFSLEPFSIYEVQQTVKFKTLSNELYQLNLLEQYAPLQFYANQYQELSYQVSKLTCNLQNQEQEDLKYGSIEYKLSLMDNDNYDTVTQVLQQGNTPSDSQNGQITYTIEPYQFQAGNTYYLLFQAINIVGGVDYGTSVYLEFEVPILDYVVYIEGGNRLQSYGQQTIVQGQYFDLNVEESQNQDSFTLNWTCLDLSTNDNCKNIEDNYINVGQSVDIQQYPSKYFIMNVKKGKETFDVLKFTFIATKNSLSVESSANIVIVEDDIPSVKVDIEKQLLVSKINLSDNIYVKIDYDEADVEGVQYTAVLIYNYDKVAVKSYYYNEFQFKVWDLFNDFLDGQYAITLKVLVYNPYYTQQAQATFNLNINQPPSSCVVSVSPTSGISAKTQFNILVQNCLDTDLGLNYKYSYYLNENDYEGEKNNGSSSTQLKKKTLQGYYSQNQLSTILPRLNQTLAYTDIIIMVSVKDQLKGYNNFTATVTIQVDPSIKNQIINLQDQFQNLQEQQEKLTLWQQINVVSVLIQDIYQGQEQLFQDSYVDQTLKIISELQQYQNELKIKTQDKVQLDQIIYNESIIIYLLQQYGNLDDIDIDSYNENLVDIIDQQKELTQQLIEQGLIYSSDSYVNLKLNSVQEVLGKSLNQYDSLVNTKIKQNSRNKQAKSLLQNIENIGQIYNNITLPNSEQVEYSGEKMKTILMKKTPQMLNSFFEENSFQNGDSTDNEITFDKNYDSNTNTNYDVQYIEIQNNILKEDFTYKDQEYPIKQTQIKNSQTQQKIDLEKPLSYYYDKEQYNLNSDDNMVCISQNDNQWNNKDCETLEFNGQYKCQCQTIELTSIVNDIQGQFSDVASQVVESFSGESLKALGEFEYQKSVLIYFLVVIITLNIYLIYSGRKKDLKEMQMAQKVKNEFLQRQQIRQKLKKARKLVQVANEFPKLNSARISDGIGSVQLTQENESVRQLNQFPSSKLLIQKRQKNSKGRKQINLFSLSSDRNNIQTNNQSTEQQNEFQEQQLESVQRLSINSKQSYNINEQNDFSPYNGKEESQINSDKNIKSIQEDNGNDNNKYNSQINEISNQQGSNQVQSDEQQQQQLDEQLKMQKQISLENNQQNEGKQGQTNQEQQKISDEEQKQQHQKKEEQQQFIQDNNDEKENNQVDKEEKKDLESQNAEKQDPFKKFSIFNTFLIFHEFFSIFFVYMAKEKRPIRYMLFFLKQYLALAFLSFFSGSDKFSQIASICFSIVILFFISFPVLLIKLVIIRQQKIVMIIGIIIYVVCILVSFWLILVSAADMGVGDSNEQTYEQPSNDEKNLINKEMHDQKISSILNTAAAKIKLTHQQFPKFIFKNDISNKIHLQTIEKSRDSSFIDINLFESDWEEIVGTTSKKPHQCDKCYAILKEAHKQLQNENQQYEQKHGKFVKRIQNK
ncbi:Insulin-like growth factor binding protein, N-terminal [Pseudocohnilembus persalinus]|uniref:Insulin-like growth factor binding protein, N-terminal n=1 Tax=Pseudocohnilembus persalinus TaxID=266149 RepID=A0A0V0QAB3_PSEPJ|nr:Insulin-like growth factor binding protein, N-terminal [Pseudocohnilembus persalinus]|eukprot:KRW99012.1 Insulin-like growth factor binding protein, N-terminal [Pseudocohnilembus persalinus]